MNKKYLLSALIGFILAFVLYFFWQEGKVRVHPEFTGIMLLKGGYRSYGVSVSDGVLMCEPPKRIWTWPRFHHCDVRPLLKSLGADEKTTCKGTP